MDGPNPVRPSFCSIAMTDRRSPSGMICIVLDPWIRVLQSGFAGGVVRRLSMSLPLVELLDLRTDDERWSA